PALPQPQRLRAHPQQPGHMPDRAHQVRVLRPRLREHPQRTLTHLRRVLPVHRVPSLLEERNESQADSSCASRHVTLSRTTPSAPHLRHHGSVSARRHSITAEFGSINWPTATSPSSSRRQNVVKSGVVKVVWGTSRSFGMVSVKSFHPPGDLDPYPANDELSPLHPRSRRAA